MMDEQTEEAAAPASPAEGVEEVTTDDALNGREIELKLALPPEEAARLRRHPRLRDWRQGRAGSGRLLSVYWDTPDQALRRAGLGLRVRRVRNGYRMSVKAANPGTSGLFDRAEWEWTLADERPNAALLALIGLPGLPSTKILSDTLRPAFATDVKRSLWTLSNGQWVVEMALDEGMIQANGAEEPLCELELELKRGTAADLFEVAAALQDDLHLTPEVWDKAARGYRLFAGDTVAPLKSVDPHLSPDMTAEAAFAAIAHACLHQYLHNAAILPHCDDVEVVHQARVGIRRLRSAISTFKAIIDTPETEAIKEELRAVGQAFGDARDLDVFADEILAPELEGLDSPGLPAFERTIAERRKAAYERAHAFVGEAAHGALMLRVVRWINHGDWRLDQAGDRPEDPDARDKEERRRTLLRAPITDLARDVLDRRNRTATKAARHFDRRSLDEIHELRVKLKKLRYAIEFFGTFWSSHKGFKRYLKDLKGLQDQLGRLNDLKTAELVAESVRADAAADADLVYTCGILTGRARVETGDVRAAASRAWSQFAERPPFWRD